MIFHIGHALSVVVVVVCYIKAVMYYSYDQRTSPSVGNCLNSGGEYAVSVPINRSIKLGFVSVNGPKQNYFVDALLKTKHGFVLE